MTTAILEPSVATKIASTFATDVRAGLMREGQKSLPPKYLYDALGSTLFEAITQLPEYGVWRAERRLLVENAEQIAALADASYIIELGSGSASKTRHLLKAALARRALSYCVVEISPAAIDMTWRELAGLPGLSVCGIEADYFSGMEKALRSRPAHGNVIVLFLGGSIGNNDYLSNVRFLQRVRRLLKPGDCLLLGADLDKSIKQVLAAYDDPLGVTAAFNLNYLLRMNRELGGNFHLPSFRHRARFDTVKHDVEMHIVSLRDQDVRVEKLDIVVSLREGETIHTESSHKYSVDELADLTSCSGFQLMRQWFDGDWRFTSALYRAE